MPLTLNDFDYTLPAGLIAQAPLAERSASRLLVVSPAAGEGPVLADAVFTDLPDLVQPGDLFVFNDARVIHARLHGVKDSGGQVEVLIERAIGPHEARAQVRASKSPKSGARLHEIGQVCEHGVRQHGRLARVGGDDQQPAGAALGQR